MTPDEIAKALAERFSGMTFSGGLGTEWLVSEIAAALRSYGEACALDEARMCEKHSDKYESEVYRRGIEDAAKVCEDNDEETVIRTGEMRVSRKVSNNRNGLAYAKAIRALSKEA